MPQQLSFPSTLGRDRHKSLIAFQCIEPRDKLKPLYESFGTKPVYGHNDAGTVFLYMPDLGERSYQQGFNTTEPMGMIEKIMAAFMGDGDTASKFTAAGQAVASSIIGTSLDKISTDIANPHTTARYEGPTLRQQTFTFELFPRNKEELVAIRDIVKFFKLHSSTRVGARATTTGEGAGLLEKAGSTLNNVLVGDRLKYPDMFVIQEISQESAKGRIMPLFKFGPAYCTSVSITDAKDRPTFGTGDSISYTLKLDFVEATMLTSADIEAGA